LNIQDIVTNVWAEEELGLLKRNMALPLDFLEDLFSSKGFVRSKNAIGKKRSKMTKEIVDLYPTKFKITVKDDIITDFEPTSLKEEAKITVKNDKKNVFETTLVVPDAHVFPGQDLSRFKALGKLANIQRPNNIVFMGDFGNFDSLSGWDQGKEASHGKKYKDDVKVCKQALSLFMSEIEKDYNPKIHFLGGNHDEGRVEKYIETHAQLRGHMDIAEDLDLGDFGIEYIPYRKFLEIEGTMFTHAMMTAANTPVSGKSITSTIASLTAKSVVVGHHHKFETMSFYRHGAEDVIQVLLCGLFCEDTPDYADGAANAYTRCVCFLTHYAHGRFDINQISIDRLKAEYL
jgi:hypothetical protein